MFRKRLFTLSLLLPLYLLQTNGCTPTNPPSEDPPEPEPPAASCPPLGSDYIEYVSGSDASSIEVYANTSGVYVSDPSTAWCSPGDLDIEVVPDLGALPTCPISSCLVALDVKPDQIDFTPYPYDGRPFLTYDLSVHPSNKSDDQLEACGGNNCFTIYQLRGGNWLNVGMAKVSKPGTKWLAKGRIKHFSIFALVELPPATPLPGPRQLGMTVASEFNDNDGDLSVAVTIEFDPDGEFGEDGREHILYFAGVDPGRIDEFAPEECQKIFAIDEQFSCFFPIGSILELFVEEGQVTLINPERAFEVGFFAVYVELY